MVIDQLERILISPLFKQSKRYSPFLRYVVEKTLSGEEDTLKERTIGVEVFGRDPLYDSNNDPIVRVTSGEVRRRIAQYYHEAGHEQELRIDLSPGSYVPEFIPSTKPRQTGVTAAMTPESLPDNSLESSTKLIQPLLGLVALVALLVFAVRWQTQHHTAVERWWKPAFHSSSPVLLSVGMLKAPASSSSEIQDVGKATQTPPDLVGLVDAVALERLAYLLSTHQQAYRTLSSVHTTYNDLRGGPAVLVAGLNNPWTLRITDPLRFHFEIIPETRTARIVDRQHPENTAWQWDFSQPHSQTQDYAIVARLHDATSEEPVFIAAGLGSSGTAAAAELLTSPSSLLELVSHLPSHWENRNIEAVIQTQVIDGQAGPPKLVSVEVW